MRFVWLAFSILLITDLLDIVSETSMEMSHRGATRNGCQNRRHKFRAISRMKLRGNIGTVSSKNNLKTSMLNVDGLSDTALADVEDFILDNKPDIVFLLETKRRLEDMCADISIPDYDSFEVRRSDVADHRHGGGIACFTRKSDGLIIRQYSPDIASIDLEYVNNERIWLKVDSLHSKTAILGVYMGCQYPDDRHGEWNDGIYQVLQQEIFKLRSEGYRIKFMGDMNGHVGSVLGQGVVGNNPDINRNGHRFLDFLDNCELRHINGECRTPGLVDTKICQGLWTRQRGSSRSIIDFAGVSSEHVDTVLSMHIDDSGNMAGNSDHNWVTLVLKDKFKRLRIKPCAKKREKWNISEDQDWSQFSNDLLKYLPSSSSYQTMSVNQLSTCIANALYSAGQSAIGFKSESRMKSRRSRNLPADLVRELKLKRTLESSWKSLMASSNDTTADNTALAAAESAWGTQKEKVSKMFAEKRHAANTKMLSSRSAFWSAVSGKVKQSADISAVLSSAGVLKCDPNDIKQETEKHFCNVFQGSLQPIPLSNAPVLNPVIMGETTVQSDHIYAVNPAPILPSTQGSDDISTNPSNWLDKNFTMSEVKSIAQKLQNNKACGFDNIPHEFIKNSPDRLFFLLAFLFNKVKNENVYPEGWNRGRITLVHKRGLRVLLSNYRPLTVLISLAGLYSKVLTARLTSVVEHHDLLGEAQGGFRKGRGAADNLFILNSIFWKARARKEKIHLGFVDITKAYDSVNRELLWKKLASIGIKGKFLGMLQSMYANDTVESVVNGVTTSPVYLRRGLRQGCSLSPILFNLYISDIGHDLTTAGEGFDIGNGITVSGLLFADDIVVIARSAPGLKNLLNLLNRRCEDLRLVISEEKSKVVAPSDDVWDVFGDEGLVVSLEQVLQYKYLGMETFSSIYKTFMSKQKKCVTTAKKYMFGCLYLGNRGSDLIKVTTTTWESVAVPAILYGCETVIFSNAKVEELETIQAQVAKRILGVPKNTSNLCAQTELGFKPIRLVLLLKQLKFYFRVLRLPNSRWVKIALLNHLSGTWHSPYLDYICGLRVMVSLHDAPPTLHYLRQHLFQWSLFQINSSLRSGSLSYIPPIESFHKALYVHPSKHLNVIASFKLSNSGLGNKCPNPGQDRLTECPRCPTPAPPTEEHLLFVCPSIQQTRVATGIDSFRTVCTFRGYSITEMFSLYVTGRDVLGHCITVEDYHERGATMTAMRTAWLQF